MRTDSRERARRDGARARWSPPSRATFDLRLIPNSEDFPAPREPSEDTAIAVMKADEFARTVETEADARLHELLRTLSS